MKNTSKIVLVLTLLFVIIILMTCFCSASTQLKYVYDDGNILSDSQEQALSEKAKAIADKYSATVAIITAREGLSYYNFPLSGYHGLDTSGKYLIMVVTHTNAWYYDLEWDGLKLSDSEANKILDDSSVYGNIKSGNIYRGLDAYLDLVEPKLYTPFSKVLAFGIICGIATAGVTVLIVVLRYKLKVKPTNYPLDKYASLKLTQANEIFTGAQTTHFTRSSGSGGKGGGGGHLGGRHSGR